MVKKQITMTKSGLENLTKELIELKKIRRPEIISRIKSAKELGDLSENAEYTAAKEEQSFIEGRIRELEEMLKFVHVVEAPNVVNGEVTLGSIVKVEIGGGIEEFQIVGSTESDPAKGKISSDSPVGKALLGQKANTAVSIKTPDGTIIYKIFEVR